MANRSVPTEPDPNSEEPVVLVVDDDEAMREALRSLLQSVDLRVEMFRSAAAFLQADLPTAPSCILLDVRLPGQSGLELQAELIREDIHIPIIFMTGHGDVPMSVKALKAGAIDFLVKPFRDQDLLEAVSAAIDLDRKRRSEEAIRSGPARPIRRPDRTRAADHAVRDGRTDEQAGRVRDRGIGDHGEDTSWQRHAENGCEVPARTRAEWPRRWRQPARPSR